ncbi:MAG: DNA repair protein RadC [Candidatus Latescibacteria bacterium]|nr:DNA repair protein RadC [Candidatus Latescibacterota bacterium]
MKSIITIKDWPEDDRPREKLIKCGPGTLSDAELLAILLRTGDAATGRNALDIARDLLKRFGGLRHAAGREISELCEVPGIGPVKAAQVKAAVEVGRRLEAPDVERVAFGSSAEVANYFIPRLRDLKKEVFKVVLLDARNKLIKEMTVSEGSLTASIVHPREVFKPAILESAAAVIFVHNHPSGDPTPSQDDLKITTQLVEAGRMIDIRVLDHIIVGHRTFTSLASKGLI